MRPATIQKLRFVLLALETIAVIIFIILATGVG